jgi:outer membrane protein assembly factor BamB
MGRHGLPGGLVALALIASAVVAAPAHAGQSTTYQQNAAHTGDVSEPGLDPPFVRKWNVDLRGDMSYAVIAQGRVFVTVDDGDVAPRYEGTRLMALHPGNGAVLWQQQLNHSRDWSGIAYGAGSLFVVTHDGVVSALNPETGAPRWSRDIGDGFTSEPSVEGNTVYVGGTGKLFALDVASGAERWSQTISGGDHSSPAVAGGRVHVGYSCDTYAFSTSTGASLWHQNDGCTGGGGKTVVAANGRVYARDYDGVHVFDAASGQRLAGFASRMAPAFAGDMLFYVTNESKLVGADRTSQAARWVAGERISTAPIVVNGSVIAGTSGGVVAFDAATGAERWRDSITMGATSPDEHNVATPLAGLAAGEGLLVVPAAQYLIAYVHGIPPPVSAPSVATPGLTLGRPPTRQLTLRPVRPDLFVGERTRLRAQLTGRGPIAGQTVALQVDEWPYDRFAPAGTAQTDGKGRATFMARPPRNVRVRAVLAAEPAVDSGAVEVYADYPALVRKVGAGGRRPRLKLRLYAPPGAAVRNVKVYAYLARTATRGFRRVAGGRWRPGGPRGSLTMTLRLPPGSLKRTHQYALCFQEASPDGYGRQTVFDQLCGEPRIPRWVTL